MFVQTTEARASQTAKANALQPRHFSPATCQSSPLPLQDSATSENNQLVKPNFERERKEDSYSLLSLSLFIFLVLSLQKM